MPIKILSYEECREDFFVNLIKHAENKIKYWKRQKGYRCEIDNNLSEAGAEISYCQDALKALEKQIPKNPIKKNPICYEKTKDGSELFAYDYFCPDCNKQIKATEHHCVCGQALDWSDTE